MLILATLVVLTVQCLAVFWWNDPELIGICAGTAILLLIVRPSYGRR